MKRSLAACVLALTGIGLTSAPPAVAQEKSVNPGINKPFEKPDPGEFIKRFEIEGRDVFDHRAKVVEACGLKPGMVVADIGAGTGLFTRMFSPLVGSRGKIFSVDIAEDFIRHIERTAKEQKLTNIVGVVTKPDEIILPPASVDVAFICDTYHHFEFPTKTMQSVHKVLKPGGRVILIDFHRIPGKSTDWVLGHVRAGKEVFVQEIVAVGFKQVEDKQDLLRESYFVQFEKVDAK